LKTPRSNSDQIGKKREKKLTCPPLLETHNSRELWKKKKKNNEYKENSLLLLLLFLVVRNGDGGEEERVEI